jgi:hypothetical protein
LQRCYNTDLSQTPSPGVVHGPYTTTSQVQSAISTAACGDTILIQAGSSLGGPPSSGVGTQITLPAKGCDDAHYITIQSTGVSDSRFPSEGTRMTPCWSGLASFPNRPAYSCPSPAVLTFQVVAPMGTSGAFIIKGDHYRIIGAEITRPSKPGLVYYLVFAPLGQTVQPNHWILDRSWIHGVNQDGHFPMAVGTTTDTNHGVFFSQGNYEAVIDSYISDIYCTGSTGGCSDAQAINGGIGGTTMTNWGAYKIVNNHLEGAAEGILFGGSGGPALTPSGCTVGVNCNIDVPADFEIRRNVFFKPQSWNGSTTTVNTYGWPVEKNGFEMKTGARLLVEGNVILNTWYDAQVGYAWDYAPKNQSGKNSSGVLVGTCATCMVTDVTHRYNYAYNVSYGMALYTSMDAGCSACQSQGANRISIHDNLIDWLNFGNLTGINGGDKPEFCHLGRRRARIDAKLDLSEQHQCQRALRLYGNACERGQLRLQPDRRLCHFE